MFKFKNVDNCPICKSKDISFELDLKNYPLTEFICSNINEDKNFTLDNIFRICTTCNHGYLSKQIDPEFLYSSNYMTTSSATSSMANFSRLLSDLQEFEFFSNIDCVIDVGANNGALLREIDKLNLSKMLFGIDPVWDESSDIPGVKGFLEEIDLDSLLTFSSKSKLFIATHVLEHISDPIQFLNTLEFNMDENDYAVLLFPSLENLILDSRFDSIHHQHFHYFSYKSFEKMLSGSNLYINSTWIDSEHYGAATLILSKKNSNFARKNSSKIDWRVYSNSNWHNSIVKSISLFKRHVDNVNDMISLQEFVGIGGGALMAPIIFYYIKNLKAIKAIYDDDPKKIGLRWANTPLKIEKTPQNLENKNVLIIGSVSKLTGRKLFEVATKKSAKTILFPTLGY